jgi:hypothetical protein
MHSQGNETVRVLKLLLFCTSEIFLRMRQGLSRLKKKHKLTYFGRQAAWAARKYRGHHVILGSIMYELEKADVV